MFQVSREKDIIVEQKNISKGKLDEATGELTWEIYLEPNTEEKINLEYSISWPKDKQLND